MHLPALVHLLIAGISEDITKARSEELQAELTERQIVEAQIRGRVAGVHAVSEASTKVEME